MKLAFRFSGPLQSADAAAKAATAWPLRAVAALIALLLQYGCAWAQHVVYLPAAHPWMAAPAVQSDLGILCERDPSRPGCERLPAPRSAGPAPQGASLALQTGDPHCQRDPSRPGCELGPRQSNPRSDKIAAAVLWGALFILGAGAASVGSAGFIMPALP
jgi:hypothetical protein